MKLLKKFSTYLLENHPLLWHTKAIQLTAIAILLWGLAYLIGFSITDMSVLREFRIVRYYEKSSFYLFHIAVIIIILAIWALHFYKNNAFKSIYPIGRFYFQKMLILLFIPFLLLISLYFPFTHGISAKTKTILSKEQLESDYYDITLASAFLPFDNQDYSLEQKCYPGEFPLSYTSFNDNFQKWENEFLKTWDSETKKSKIRMNYTYPDSDITIVDSMKLIFYSEEFREVDKCSSLTAISKIHKYDTKKTPLELNSIWNYSGISMIVPRYSLNMDYEKKDYRTHFAPTVHKIGHAKDWESISKIIDKAKRSLSRYDVNYHIDNAIVIKYLKEKNFRDLRKIMRQHAYSSRSFEHKLGMEKMTKLDYESLNFIEKLEFFPLYHIAYPDLHSVYENYQSTSVSLYDDKDSYVFLFLSLGLAFLAVYFQIVKPIPFLLSIPVWGVLFILMGVYNILFPIRNYMYQGNTIQYQFLFVFGLVQIVNIVLWKFFQKGKNVFNITTAMAIAGSAFVFPLILQIIHYASKIVVYEPCTSNHEEYIFGGWLQSIPVILFSAAFGMLLSLFLARIWMAKKE